MEKLTVTCAGCLVIVALYATIGFISAWVIEWAWNLIVPTLFHGPRIDYWVAYAIYVALSIIGGIFRGPQGKS